MSGATSTDFERDGRRYRWREDVRIKSIVAAPPGWVAVFCKSAYDGHDPTGDFHDVAWVEPIACFALLEVIEREEVLEVDDDGDEHWRSTGRDERTIGSAGGPDRPDDHFLHTMVVPVWWDSGEQNFPGADELMPFGSVNGRRPSYVFGPGTRFDAPEWLVKELRDHPAGA